MLNLNEIRKEIDSVDSQIVNLFEERMNLCKQVAEYKIENGKEVLDRGRERDKLDRIKSMTAGGEFMEHGTDELFTQIMAISRKLQYRLLTEHGIASGINMEQVNNLGTDGAKVVYQGVKGAYSEQAMFNYFGETVDCYNVSTFRDAMDEIDKGSADFAVLPIENTTAGIVSDVYDLLTEFDNYIVAETDVKICHALIGLKDAEISDIKMVYSHPQGLMQCAKFLEEHSDMQGMSYPNTAASAKKVFEDNDKSQAAIASVNAAKLYNLKVLKENVNYNDNNTTRFVIVSKKKMYSKDARKIIICFEAEHKSGSLYNMLSHFIYNGLNMTKIESRPIVGKNWEYRFYIEFEGRLDDAGVQNALRGIKEEAITLKILGNY